MKEGIPEEGARGTEAARRFRAEAGDDGLRLDVWLHGCLPDCSRSRLQQLIRQGHVTGTAGRLTAHTRVSAGLEVEVRVPDAVASPVAGEAIPLDILFEDDDLLVLNKPPGLVVHPAAGHPSGTLVNALLHHCPHLPGIGGERRPGIVHRLDKDTSGAMVVAKTQQAMERLTDLFKKGEVRKEYRVLVYGVPARAEGRIETLIGRSSTDRKKMSARVQRGRRAVSHYRLEATLGSVSLLRVRIETGRTHQIRVHMAHVGLPVLGDRQYGRAPKTIEGLSAPLERQMLHAEVLEFRHPVTGQMLSITAPLAPDMGRVLDGLRRLNP